MFWTSSFLFLCSFSLFWRRHSFAKKWFVWFKMISPEVFFTLVSPCQSCSTDVTVERKVFLIDKTSEGDIFKFEVGWWRSSSGSLAAPFSHDFEQNTFSSYFTNSAIFDLIVLGLFDWTSPLLIFCQSICLNHFNFSWLLLIIIILLRE